MKKTQSTYLIGIAGGSASGKTYLLQQLRERFPETDLGIISQDDYYRPLQEQPKDEKNEVNFDLPEGIDVQKFRNDLQALHQGKTITVQEYTFNNPEARPVAKVLQPAPVIVVEGLFIFYFPEIMRQLDLKVFLDAREDIRLSRRLRRDMTERGIPEETVMYQWDYHVVPAYRRYLLPYREECDLIVTNNHTVEKGLELLRHHIKAICNGE
ncbi:MAG: uridine-cytidine kinase [Bacteroidia bacterium]